MLAMISWISLGVAFACALFIAIDVLRHPQRWRHHEHRLAGDRALSQRLRDMGLFASRAPHG